MEVEVDMSETVLAVLTGMTAASQDTMEAIRG